MPAVRRRILPRDDVTRPLTSVSKGAIIMAINSELSPTLNNITHLKK
jgi:hypothetical protein